MSEKITIYLNQLTFNTTSRSFVLEI